MPAWIHNIGRGQLVAQIKAIRGSFESILASAARKPQTTTINVL